MNQDTIVFDIETSNFFTDPGVGWDNYAALKISVVGAYSYGQDRYFAFEENEMGKLAELFRDAKTVVGFCSNQYDTPVLHHHFQRAGIRDIDLWKKERVDLLEIVQSATGQRISLSRLSEANLGVKKDKHGSQAAALYREGKIAELKEYCLKDVRLTKELYDVFRKDHAFMVPNKATGETTKVVFPKPAAVML
jgi:DEAD/DEAH box helicase domain-containing protein